VSVQDGTRRGSPDQSGRRSGRERNASLACSSSATIWRSRSFVAFGVGFLVRPLGGVLFGHLGDKIGRRETLVITTLVMGVAIGLIGLLPTYAAVGVWAPVILTLLRVCQGLGAGAEFGGASTLLVEHAPPARRGFFGSFAQTGVQVGSVLGTTSFLLVGLLPDEQFESWAGASRSWPASC
jgi:MHS family shikimate/dehydroshikimate transporter-like MFS transporter